MSINIHILTLSPDLWPGALGESVIGNALEKGLWNLSITNIRDFATDKHGSVDGIPYGGGAGMVLRSDIVASALDHVMNKDMPIYYPSPRGKLYTQSQAKEISESKDVMFLCGRFEGLDQRVIDHYGIIELSLGDYVLSNGDIAAICMIDACLRNIDGVLGSALSGEDESFGAGDYAKLLEYPHYTRPQVWNNIEVPKVLRSGHHGNIASWRKEQAVKLTKARRPELLD